MLFTIAQTQLSKMDLLSEIVDIIVSYLHPYHRNQYRLTCKHAYSSTSINENIELSLIYNPIPESLQYYDPLHCLYYALKSCSDINIFLNNLKDISVKVAIIIGALLFEFKKEDHLLLLSETHKHAFVFRSILHAYSISFFQAKPQWNIIPNIYESIIHELSGRDLWKLFAFMTPLNQVFLLGSLTIVDTIPFGIGSLPYRQTKKCLGRLRNEELPAAKFFLNKHFPTFHVNTERSASNELVTCNQGLLSLPSTPFSIDEENSYHKARIRELPESQQGMYWIFSGFYDEYVKWKQNGNKFTFVTSHNIFVRGYHCIKFEDRFIDKPTSILGITSYNNECLNTPVHGKKIPKNWYY